MIMDRYLNPLREERSLTILSTYLRFSFIAAEITPSMHIKPHHINALQSNDYYKETTKQATH